MFRIKDGISLAGSTVLDGSGNHYGASYTATTSTIGDTAGHTGFALILNSNTSTASDHKLLFSHYRETAGSTSSGTYDEIGRYLGANKQGFIRFRDDSTTLSDAYKYALAFGIGSSGEIAGFDTHGSLVIGKPIAGAANPSDVKLNIFKTSGKVWFTDGSQFSGTSKIAQIGWANGDILLSADILGQATSSKISFAVDGTEYGYLNTSGFSTTQQFTSSVATGTAPLVITSTTLVSNLNADLLDGNHASAFATSGHTHSYLPTSGNTTYSGGILTVQNDNSIDVTTTGSINGLQVYQGVAGADALMTFHIGSDFALHFGLDGETNDLTVGGWSMGAAKYKIWHAGNDGTGSGLDADTLDGNHASAFASSSHTHNYLSPTSANRPGVTKLYRRDEDSNYNVQTYWTGSYWHLDGYNGDTYHAGCQVAYADSAGYAPLLSPSGTASNANTQFTDTPAHRVSFIECNGSANAPNAGWHFLETYRHSNAGNYWGTQYAHGWEDNANRMWKRNITGGSFGSWVEFITSGNIGSQSVNYAAYSGYATYLSNGTNSATLYANTASSYGAWSAGGSRNGWYGFHIATSNAPHIMFDGSGNGGMYHETGGRWPLYYNYANNCMGVCTSATASGYAIYAAGSIYATSSVFAASDERIKKEITTITGALDTINKLRGVSYIKLQDRDEQTYTEKREIGVIAQEVLPHVPEVVNYDEENDRYSVSYANFAGLFIEAIKEQQKMIDDLKKEIEILKGER